MQEGVRIEEWELTNLNRHKVWKGKKTVDICSTTWNLQPTTRYYALENLSEDRLKLKVLSQALESAGPSSSRHSCYFLETVDKS